MFKNYEIILHIFLGGLLFGIAHYLSKNKKDKLVALIPSIPILGIYGLLLTIKNKNNLKIYLSSILYFVFIGFVFYSLILIIYKFSNNILLSLSISIIVWITLIYFCM